MKKYSYLLLFIFIGFHQSWSQSIPARLKANIPPIIDLSSSIAGNDFQTTYTESGAATRVVNTDLVITDTDSPTMTGATIILTNTTLGDTIKLVDTTPSGITPNISKTGKSLTITLSGVASISLYITAIKQLFFENTGKNVVSGNRSINIQLNDGIALSNTAKSTIVVTSVNDAPTLLIDADKSSGSLTPTKFITKFTENASSIKLVDNDIKIQDVDDTTIAYALFTLTNRNPGDTLVVEGALPSGMNSSLILDASSLTVKITGEKDFNNYYNAMQLVKYYNKNDNPLATDRSINITINDGNVDAVVTNVAIITIIPINDTPILDLDANNSSGITGNNFKTNYIQGGANSNISDNDLTLFDLDHLSMAKAIITLTNKQIGDTLIVNTSLPPGVVSKYTSVTNSLTLTLTGTALIGEYINIIKNMQFKNSFLYPSETDRIIEITVNDGIDNSITAISTVRFKSTNPTFNTVNGKFCQNEILTINGTNLTNVKSVTFGLVKTTIQSQTDTEIKVNLINPSTETDTLTLTATNTAVVKNKVQTIVYPTPTASLSGPSSIVKGNNALITANLGGTGPWKMKYNDGVTDILIDNITSSVYQFNVSPTVLTNYVLKAIEDNSGCIGSISTAVLQIDVLPVSIVITDQPKNITSCKGTTVTFNVKAISAVSFQWQQKVSGIFTDLSNSSIYSGVSTSELTIKDITTSLNQSEYRCIVNGIENSASAILSIPAIGLPNIPNPTVKFCHNGTSNPLQASVFNASELLWWGTNATGGTSSFTAPNPSTSTVGTFNYYVSQKDVNNCEGDRASIKVVVNPIPTASFADTALTICENKTLTSVSVKFTGASPYRFAYHVNTDSTIITGITSNPYSLSITPIAGQKDQSYHLEGISGDGCFTNLKSNTWTLHLAPKPVVNLNASTKTICKGDSTTLSVNFSAGKAPFSISYLDGTNRTISGIKSSIYTFQVKPNTTQIYSLTNVSDTFCITGNQTGSATVNVEIPKQAGFSYQGNPFCKTGTNPTPTLNAGAIGGKFNCLNPSLIVDETTGTVDLNKSQTGVYVVFNTISATSTCPKIIAHDTLRIGAIPTASLSIQNVIGKSTTICEGDTIKALLQVNGLQPIHLKFRNNTKIKDTVIYNNILSKYPFKTAPLLTSTYEIISIHDTACQTPVMINDSVTINVKPKLGQTGAAELLTKGSFNCNNNGLKIYIKTVQPGVSYQWYRNGLQIMNETKDTLTAFTKGKYSVNITSCFSSNTINIDSTIIKTKIPKIEAYDIGTNYGSLTTDSLTGAKYQWYLNDFKLLGATSKKVEVIVKGTYKVAVSDDNCTSFSKPTIVNDSAYPDARLNTVYLNDSTISIAFEKHNQYYISPNPSSDIIKISGPDMTIPYSICIRNLTGTKVYEYDNILNINNEHDIMFLPSGIYLIELKLNNQSYYHKLLKQ